MTVSEELLSILACPKCKGKVSLNNSGDGIVCEACALVFPIKDDIPSMIIDEAKKLG